jgi:DNA-binding NtrC family response regulator
MLKYDFSTVITLNDPGKIPSAMEKHQVDLVLLDMNFSPGATSGAEGLKWLRVILEMDPQAVVIPMTAFGDIDLAVRAMQAGGIDFILKPWDPTKLMATIMAAYQLRQSRREVKNLQDAQRMMDQDVSSRFDMLVGSSPGLEQLKDVSYKAAASDASILITGENGTGKELIAREIHRWSARSASGFISVDMGSLSESLFESEMFGHKKGAYTDAGSDRSGRFEIASGGTLFLDEIGNLSMHLQSKLLRVLEEDAITPVGSNVSIPVDTRLITATNRNLKEMIRGNVFREDLYFRINTIELRIPSLRERAEDIPLLLDYFLRSFEQKYNKAKRRISSKAMDALIRYQWPGNIRELKHMSEKAVILNESGVLEPEDFFPQTHSSADSMENSGTSLAAIEKAAIENALKAMKGNISRAARMLDISRTTLYSKMEKHGI